MSIKFRCPNCQSKLTVANRYAGRRGTCPKCDSRVDIPDQRVKSLLAQAESKQDDGNAESLQSPEIDSPDVIVPASQTVEQTSELRGTIPLPRWAVYMQGALLGIIATTFFVFGLMVGLKTQVVAEDGPQFTSCSVRGSVYYDTGNYRRADFGAVVIALPSQVRPDPRPEAEMLAPHSFVPLDNPSIEAIRQIGGDVVRVNDDGSYQLTLAASQSYWLLVISKNQRAGTDEISKQTRAELGAYFFPIEDLLQRQAFHWSSVTLSSDSHQRPDIAF